MREETLRFGHPANTCTMRVAKMLLALMSPGIPKYWMPFLEKMVAPASNQGTWLVPFSVSGTTHPAGHLKASPQALRKVFAETLLRAVRRIESITVLGTKRHRQIQYCRCIYRRLNVSLLRSEKLRMDLTKSTKHGPSSMDDLNVPVSLKCGRVC